MRAVVVAGLVCACGRSQGVADRDLGGLVVAPNQKPPAIDVAKSATDPDALALALMLPLHDVTTAIGPHATTLAVATHVTEAGKPVSDLDEKIVIELGAKGEWHAVYTNSADYGRETTFTGGKLYLRPRYQRWHQRDPETPDEAQHLGDTYYDAVAATWDLLAPGVELTDKGAAQVAGRAGRKIEVKPAPSPRKPPPESLAQRKWREGRSIDALAGEIVLDADKGVPLSVKLSGTVGFSREGRRFAMQVTVQSDVTTIGAAAIAVPNADEVVATPERMREVDDRDYLLQGIAPPLKKTPGGQPAPRVPSGSGAGSGSGAIKPAAGSGAGSAATKPGAGSATKPAAEKRDAKPASEKSESEKRDAKPASEKSESEKRDAKPASEKSESEKRDAKPASEKGDR